MGLLLQSKEIEGVGHKKSYRKSEREMLTGISVKEVIDKKQIS